MYLHGLECNDPIRQYNDYGHMLCSTVAGLNNTLWDHLGYRTRFWDITAHTVSECFYDDRWHFYDGDMHCVYLLRDNETVADDTQIARDHDLVKRTHSNGILLVDTQWDGQGTCALYFTESEIAGERSGKAATQPARAPPSRDPSRAAKSTQPAPQRSDAQGPARSGEAPSQAMSPTSPAATVVNTARLPPRRPGWRTAGWLRRCQQCPCSAAGSRCQAHGSHRWWPYRQL